MNERHDFHPLVATWLENNGYSYRHEVKMPEYGRADFIAIHEDGHTLIVECKIDVAAKSKKSLKQLLRYQRQIADSKAGYAIPLELVSDSIAESCVAYGIQLIPIYISDEIKNAIQLAYTNTVNHLDSGNILVDNGFDDLFGRVALHAYRDFQKRFSEKMKAYSYINASEAHMNVISQIDADGTRIVKLAERANMTKQSMGDLVGELEQKGYVTRTPDLNDKRATIIHFSERGQQFLLDAYAVKLEMEAEYAAILGQAEMEQFMIFARKLLEHAYSDPIL